MGATKLADILLTPLDRIKTPSGDVMHAVKCSDSGFVGFGEAYFSWIQAGAIKAWKCHQKMTLNLVVPVGEVRFVFHDPNSDSFCEEIIGECRYIRITVPPGLWFGFQGNGLVTSLVMNLADIEHDPNESLRKPISDIFYNWGN